MNSAYVLARALTISIRYSIVRVQGFVDIGGSGGSGGVGSGEERAVMDYPTQQRVLMPLLALTYALHFTGVKVKENYDKYLEQTKMDNFSLLSELHASSAGLKAYITDHVAEGMEVSRWSSRLVKGRE